jgi:hypothetical protein
VFFVAVPVVLVTLYTTVSLGGYGEVLLIGNLLLLVALYGLGSPQEAGEATGPRRVEAGVLGAWLLLGLLGGFGFWAFPLIAVYLIPIGAYTLASLWHAPRRLAAALLLSAVGFAVGRGPRGFGYYRHARTGHTAGKHGPGRGRSFLR